MAAANGLNCISIPVPCHRVVGTDGHLTGYGGGLWRKKWLLALEAEHAQADADPKRAEQHYVLKQHVGIGDRLAPFLVVEVAEPGGLLEPSLAG